MQKLLKMAIDEVDAVDDVAAVGVHWSMKVRLRNERDDVGKETLWSLSKVRVVETFLLDTSLKVDLVLKF
jgi:hypothetical protein